MASMQRVQDSLNGLVFGFPLFGLNNPQPGYTCYHGKNHTSGKILNSKYFLHEPNPSTDHSMAMAHHQIMISRAEVLHNY